MHPVVRLFVALSSGRPDTPFADFRIADIKTILFPAPGSVYPLLHPELCFYATVTGCRGAQTFVLQQRLGVGPGERLVWQSRPVMLDLGDDPLAVRGIPLRMKNLPFPRPGQYEFVLLCDGVELASFYLEARV